MSKTGTAPAVTVVSMVASLGSASDRLTLPRKALEPINPAPRLRPGHLTVAGADGRWASARASSHWR